MIRPVEPAAVQARYGSWGRTGRRPGSANLAGILKACPTLAGVRACEACTWSVARARVEAGGPGRRSFRSTPAGGGARLLGGRRRGGPRRRAPLAPGGARASVLGGAAPAP